VTDLAENRAHVLALVQRYGWNATAFQTLESGYSYYFDGDDACVAYVDTGSAWVAAGAPISAMARLPQVAAAFERAAVRAQRRCCFVATEARFQELMPSWSALAIGEQPIWDPHEWTQILAQHKSLREQLRRARAKGVRVRALDPAELEPGPMRDALSQLTRRWLATRNMARLGFLVQLEPFTQPAHRQCFVAEREGALVGFAGAVPVPARNGWFLEDVIRDPSAPNGTNELLMDAMQRWAAAHGCDWLTLGLAPLAGEISGLLKLARALSMRVYNFEGLRSYKDKLRPRAWSPIYLSHPASQSEFLSVLDVLAAFAPGGLLRFGVRSVRRGSPIVIGVMATLLAPWTVLLALTPAHHWFGSSLLKWGWVVFDAGLLAGLYRWLHRPNLPLLTGLASLVSADALITTLQGLIWNLPRARGWFEIAIIIAVCAMPALAATSLWGARARSVLEQRAAPRVQARSAA
jgi:phosphatidylglycerol lysyltransferase